MDRPSRRPLGRSLALVAAVLLVAGPTADARAANRAELRQVRADTAKLKAQVKGLKAKARDLREQADALEELTGSLEQLTASLDLRTSGLQSGLSSRITRTPFTSLNNWIAAAPGAVPLTLQGGGEADLQQWLDGAGNTAARMSSDGVLSAASLYTNRSVNLLGTGADGVSIREPLVNYWNNGELKWQSGLDAANSENDDFVPAARARPGGVFDVIYLRDTYPEGDVAIGMGLAPPLPGFRTQIGSPDGSDWGALLLRIGENGTGDPLRVINSAGTRLLSVDRLGRLVPADGAALRVLGDLRVRSTDIEDPSGLVLNGNPTDTGSDFQLRNLFNPALSTYLLQILAADGRVFAQIRQDTGEVQVTSGRIRLGSGTLVEEDGGLRWIAPSGAVTVLAAP